ncbi:hypothetical protein KAR91_30885 [Candidatus Pacearchaeota archaeon]|nr:hypothetical protein [Candidatus Pacearchaeota archaeon]
MAKLITLEQLLKSKVKSTDKDDNEIEIIPDFRVSVQKTFDRGVLFIIHPEGYSGDTLDFMVSDNLLTDPKGGRLKRLSKVPAAEKVIITKDDIGSVEGIL